MNISPVTPCFTPGTQIATERGAVAVEALRPADRVVTRDNGLRRVHWIGRRDVDLLEDRERRGQRLGEDCGLV